jgi:hypothetical protein
MNVAPTLHDAIENAKNFENFDDVLLAVSLHPQWLTMIPEPRVWSILHHIVYSGNIDHLEQLLALQKTNKDFRLLSKTKEDATILDIAQLRDDQPEMLKRIERLVRLDTMLNYSRECEWDKCYEIVKENPAYGNEKPPYRRYYLIHHMACANVTGEFERFKKIPNFKYDLTLRADRKKINVTAREDGYGEFAEYIEKQYPSLFNDDNELYEPSEKANKQTDTINVLMEHRTVWYESDVSMEPLDNVKTRGQVDKSVAHKLSKQKKQASSTNEPGHDLSNAAILNILKCSLTNAIVTDPGEYYNQLVE